MYNMGNPTTGQKDFTYSSSNKKTKQLISLEPKPTNAKQVTENGYRQVAKSAFSKLWSELCPFVVVARGMADLSWQCHRNTTRIYRSDNLTVREEHNQVHCTS